MADIPLSGEHSNDFFKTVSGGVVSQNPDKTNIDVNDFKTWDWKQIQAAVIGASAIDTGSKAFKEAQANVDPMTLSTTGQSIRLVHDTLAMVHNNLLAQTRALAGDGKPWEGPGAEAFRASMKNFAAHIQANAERLNGGVGGSNSSIADQLTKAGNSLAYAQAEIKRVDLGMSAWAQAAGIGVGDGNVVPISKIPWAPDWMKEQMTAVVDWLGGEYRVVYDAVISPSGDAGTDGSSATPSPPTMPKLPAGGSFGDSDSAVGRLRPFKPGDIPTFEGLPGSGGGQGADAGNARAGGDSANALNVPPPAGFRQPGSGVGGVGRPSAFEQPVSGSIDLPPPPAFEPPGGVGASTAAPASTAFDRAGMGAPATGAGGAGAGAGGPGAGVGGVGAGLAKPVPFRPPASPSTARTGGLPGFDNPRPAGTTAGAGPLPPLPPGFSRPAGGAGVGTARPGVGAPAGFARPDGLGTGPGASNAPRPGGATTGVNLPPPPTANIPSGTEISGPSSAANRPGVGTPPMMPPMTPGAGGTPSTTTDRSDASGLVGDNTRPWTGTPPTANIPDDLGGAAPGNSPTTFDPTTGDNSPGNTPTLPAPPSAELPDAPATPGGGTPSPFNPAAGTGGTTADGLPTTNLPGPDGVPAPPAGFTPPASTPAGGVPPMMPPMTPGAGGTPSTTTDRSDASGLVGDNTRPWTGTPPTANIPDDLGGAAPGNGVPSRVDAPPSVDLPDRPGAALPDAPTESRPDAPGLSGAGPAGAPGMPMVPAATAMPSTAPLASGTGVPATGQAGPPVHPGAASGAGASPMMPPMMPGGSASGAGPDRSDASGLVGNGAEQWTGTAAGNVPDEEGGTLPGDAGVPGPERSVAAAVDVPAMPIDEPWGRSPEPGDAAGAAVAATADVASGPTPTGVADGPIGIPAGVHLPPSDQPVGRERTRPDRREPTAGAGGAEPPAGHVPVVVPGDDDVDDWDSAGLPWATDHSPHEPGEATDAAVAWGDELWGPVATPGVVAATPGSEPAQPAHARWRPSPPTPGKLAEADAEQPRTYVSGGPDLTPEESRAVVEAYRRAHEEAQRRAAGDETDAPDRDGSEGEQADVERRAADLLKQDSKAWGQDAGSSGVIG